jgi:hypothetical protein
MRASGCRSHASRVGRSGLCRGVAANMIGLVYVAAAQYRRADALATLDEAQAIASAHRAQRVVRDSSG